jgi:hypothetical protein
MYFRTCLSTVRSATARRSRNVVSLQSFSLRAVARSASPSIISPAVEHLFHGPRFPALGGHPDPAMTWTPKMRPTKHRRAAMPSPLSELIKKVAFLQLGTQSPTPWDLPLSSQNFPVRFLSGVPAAANLNEPSNCPSAHWPHFRCPLRLGTPAARLASPCQMSTSIWTQLAVICAGVFGTFPVPSSNWYRKA